ncbi:MAG: hypothetical protein RIR95_383 [Pseudomonadota bacterium]|jgi:phosphatidate cytidylyltransferase
MNEVPGRWGDLRPRVLSAVAMLAVGGVDLWAGGWFFALLAVIITGLMMWELARMTRVDRADFSIGLGAIAGLVLALNLWFGWAGSPMALTLLLPGAIGVFAPRRDRKVFFAYALIIMLTGLCLVILRNSLGLAPMLWLISVVIVSDVMGYFAGRILGGPKFWPAVSPKKTWSGTAAGWVGAAVVGWGCWLAGFGGSNLIWVSPLIAFAGQMGDIAESAIKRRAGVKDSSNLIPGHGGLLDRFDALAFAAIAFAALQSTLPVF